MSSTLALFPLRAVACACLLIASAAAQDPVPRVDPAGTITTVAARLTIWMVLKDTIRRAVRTRAARLIAGRDRGRAGRRGHHARLRRR